MNSFSVIEKYILQKINRNLSVVICAAYPELKMNSIIDFLERQKDNIFIECPKKVEGFGIGEILLITNCSRCTHFRGSTQSTDLNKKKYMLANPKYIYCAYREKE